MSAQRRQLILLAVVGALGLLVLADQFGWLGVGRSEDDEEGTPTARSVYLARARLAESQAALLEQADEWKRAAAAAEEEWERARSGMIVDRTVELAEARFRDVAIAALQRDLRLKSPRATPIRDRAAPSTESTGGAPRVQTLSMEVMFDAATQRDAYAAIDRLEGLGAIRTRITSLRMDGPGRTQVGRQITVTLTLQAQAAVGEAA